MARESDRVGAHSPKAKSTRGLKLHQVVHALRQAGGNRALAARMLGVDRSTITKFAHRHPELAGHEAEIMEECLDLCEAQLIVKIRDGDVSAIRYFLDKHGGARGYGKSRIAFSNDKEPEKPPQPKGDRMDLSRLTVVELRRLETLHIRAMSESGDSSEKT